MIAKQKTKTKNGSFKRASRAALGTSSKPGKPGKKRKRKTPERVPLEVAQARVQDLHGHDLLKFAGALKVSTGGNEGEIKERIVDLLTGRKRASRRRSDVRVYDASMIKETADDLTSMVASGDYTAAQIERIEALLLLKTGAAKSGTEVQKLLGISWPTAQKWLSKYHDEGLEALLDFSTGGRSGLPTKVESRIAELGRNKELTPNDVLKALREEGLDSGPGWEVEYIDVYSRLERSQKQSYQTKMPTALLNAIEAYCKAKDWDYKFPPGQCDWPDLLLDQGIDALRSNSELSKKRKLVVRQREIPRKAHLTKWVTPLQREGLEEIRRPTESELNLLRRVFWAGMQDRPGIPEVAALQVK